MEKIISGIQQIGIGTPDEEKAFSWYRNNFGMDIQVFQEAADAPLMTDYTGNEVQSRSATLAMNLQGGGGLEIWQYTSRSTKPPSFEIVLGDLGVFAARIKCRDIAKSYHKFRSEALNIVSEINTDPGGNPHFFVEDPHGLMFQIVEGNSWFTSGKHHTGGLAGCMIGVSDIDRSLHLYRDILEYDTIEYDLEGEFDDLRTLSGGAQKVRRVLLSHSQPRKGSFCQLLGPTKIELVQTYDREPRRIFKNRYWGDLGFIHLCFDIKGMDQLKSECRDKGFNFTVDSKGSFEMGEAAGRFSYIEDPDGMLIEFVETHKIPIWKDIGWYLDVRGKSPETPLPKWLLQFLRLSRVRN